MTASRTAEFCLDASAVLALMQAEPGAGAVANVLDKAVMHSVNAFEVIRKLRREGVPFDAAVSLLEELHIRIVEELPLRHIKAAATLFPQAETLGLSLGDCVCLLLGEQMNCTILTSEKRWSKVRLRSGKIQQIR